MAVGSSRNETLVGLFVFVGLALLAALILLFGNAREWFQDRYELTVYFEEASGVIPGSTVRFRGTKVGKVGAKPELTPEGKVEILLEIDEQFKIPEGATFRIGQASLLGDKEVLITPPETLSGQVIEPGANLAGAEAGGLDQLQNDAEVIARETRMLLKDARSALTKVEASVDEIRSVAGKLNQGLDRVNTKLLSEENLRNLSDALENAKKATAVVGRFGSKLDPALEEARAAFVQINGAARDIRSLAGSVEPALENVPEVLASIERTSEQASAAIRKVQSGEGALGALAYDRETKEDVQSFIKNLRKKGILRYRDEETPAEDPRDRFRGRRR